MWKKLKAFFKDLFFITCVCARVRTCVCVWGGVSRYVPVSAGAHRGQRSWVPLGLELESQVVMSHLIRLVGDQMSRRCSFALSLSVPPLKMCLEQ